MRVLLYLEAVMVVLILSGVKSEPHKYPPCMIVKGAFMLPLKDIVLHNSKFPLEIVVELPSINLESVTRECKTKPYLCKLLNHSIEVKNLLAEEIYEKNPYITGFRNDSSTLERTNRGLFDFVGEIHKFLWGDATEGDIDDLHVQMGQMAIKFNELSQQSTQFMDSLASNLSTYSKKLSSVVEKGFSKVEDEIRRNAALVNEAELVFSDVMNNLILNQHIQSVTDVIDSIASDCRNQLIPRAAVKDENLMERLNLVNQTVAGHGYKLAATPNQMFKLKITSCFFAKDYVKLVINVPIKRQNLKIYRLLHAPYSFLEKECVLSESPNYVVQANDSIIPITSDMSQFCSPATEKLCMVPEGIYEPTQFAACAQSLLGQNQDGIVSNCILQCKKANRVRIQALSSKHFHVANARNITIHCLGGEKEKYYLQKQVGATIVNLNCNCQANVFDPFLMTTRVLKPSWPCNTKDASHDLKVMHIIPAQMSKLKSAMFQESSELFQNVSDIYNDKWNFEVPTLSINSPKKVQFSSEFIYSQLKHSVSYSTTILYIWLTVLTVALIVIGVMVVINFSSSSRGFNMVPFMAIFLPGLVLCEEEENTNITFKAHMWKIIELLEISNVIVGAVIVVAVLSILVIMYKTLKKLRLCNRILHTIINGGDNLL